MLQHAAIGLSTLHGKYSSLSVMGLLLMVVLLPVRNKNTLT